jgi:hypothetical protein
MAEIERVGFSKGVGFGFEQAHKIQLGEHSKKHHNPDPQSDQHPEDTVELHESEVVEESTFTRLVVLPEEDSHLDISA